MLTAKNQGRTMKRKHLMYVRTISIIMSFLVATLAICNLLTIATKSIEVTIPDENDISWSIDPQQKQIIFRTSFSVKNHGTYDISDIDISAQLLKDNEKTLISFEKQNMVVQRGCNKTFDIIISLDLDTISWFDWMSLMYKNTSLQLVLDIDASYMLGLVGFTVDENIDIPWSCPIQNITENEMVQEGVTGVMSLLNIADNSSLSSISDVFSLYALADLNITTENGFAFNLNLSDYSETLKKISIQITTPLIVLDGMFVFSAEVLFGLDEGVPMVKIQQVVIQYVE